MKYVSTWQRSFTAKKCLHPPFSEKMATLWPDAKVVLGTVYGVGGQQPDSCGFRVLRGEYPAGLPREESEQNARQDGVPIHSVTRRTERCFFEMECFCDIKRSPTVFTKLTFDNRSARPSDEWLTLIMRTGRETLLTGSDDDGYSPYISDSAPWLAMPSAAVCNGGVLCEGDCRLSVNGADFEYRGEGMLRLRFPVAPGEKRELFLAFGENAPQTFDYFAEREKAEKFWLGELAAIKTLPASDDPETAAVCRNLTAQILQLFASPKGRDYVLPRQGGMQRLIWPSEFMPVCEALCSEGDFSKYLRPVMDTYFGVLQGADGQITNFGVPWASVTGCCLYSFGRYTYLADDRECFEKYRENALRAVRWIDKTRRSTEGDPRYFGGLFPPMRSCDYEQPGAQCWGNTDMYNLDALRVLVDAFRKFSGAGLDELISCEASYRAAAKAVADRICAAHPTGPFTFPVDPHDDPAREAEFEKGIAPRREVVTPTILNLGLIPEDTGIPERLEQGCRELGVFGRGLTWLMADRGVFRDGHKVWYGSYVDLEWFKWYMRSGRRDSAKEVLDAQLRYIMTPEYYMFERYDDSNPYYTPWMPNGSANARTMLMLFAWYGDNKL